MKNIRKIVLAVLCTLLIATLLPFRASAGTNGQQIKAKFSGLNCVAQWTVTVKGYNQYGVYTVKSKTALPSTIGCEIPMTGSWWKGNVTVTAKRTVLGGSYTKQVYVPKSQLSNWVVVKFP